MSFFSDEKAKEFEAIGYRNQRRNLKQLKQVGRSNQKVDEHLKALLPGKRMSKSGNVYWETRKNRSDKKGSKT
jgi:hypothetical protein